MIAASIIALLTFVSMFSAGQIAKSRGRSVRIWLWLAALFGPFALVAAWLLPIPQGRDRHLARRA